MLFTDRDAENFQFPEGTIFVGNELYFVDYSTSDVLRLVDGKVKKVWHQDGCGANGLVQVPNALLVACFDSGTVVKISLDGKPLKTIGKDSAGTHFTNPNDLRLMLEVVCISPPLVQTTQIWGKVFYFSSDQTVREVASGIHFAHRRALHRAIGTKDAAITGLRTQ